MKFQQFLVVIVATLITSNLDQVALLTTLIRLQFTNNLAELHTAYSEGVILQLAATPNAETQLLSCSLSTLTSLGFLMSFFKLSTKVTLSDTGF